MMPNGDWYFGNWIMGEFIKGLARETWPNGNFYVGSFNNKAGKGRTMEGYGEFTWKTKNDKKYSGMWKDGKMHGIGKMEWKNGKVVYR
jgi:hypothetical protein